MWNKARNACGVRRRIKEDMREAIMVCGCTLWWLFLEIGDTVKKARCMSERVSTVNFVKLWINNIYVVTESRKGYQKNKDVSLRGLENSP